MLVITWYFGPSGKAKFEELLCVEFYWSRQYPFKFVFFHIFQADESPVMVLKMVRTKWCLACFAKILRQGRGQFLSLGLAFLANNSVNNTLW
jgi:hypothetical protein